MKTQRQRKHRQSRMRVKSRRPARDWLLILLTGSAGSIDAAVFLKSHVFTANMTGNTVLLGLGLARVQSISVGNSLFALCGFCFGAGIATWIVQPLVTKRRWSHKVNQALSLAAFLLLASGFAASLPGRYAILGTIAAVAAAMGIQSASAQHLAVPGRFHQRDHLDTHHGDHAHDQRVAIFSSGRNESRWPETALCLLGFVSSWCGGWWRHVTNWLVDSLWPLRGAPAGDCPSQRARPSRSGVTRVQEFFNRNRSPSLGAVEGTDPDCERTVNEGFGRLFRNPRISEREQRPRRDCE